MEVQDIARMNASDYKAYHESLMQNNNGSSALHVFFCILFTVQCTLYSSVQIKQHRYQEFYEYLVIVLPMIMAHTFLSDYLYQLNLIISAFLLWEVKTHFYLRYIDNICREKSYHHKRVQTISILRGLTYLITVLCILAVDFTSFPRALAKTERYGYSLMDTGVGLFVLMSGLVHKDLLRDHWRTVFLGNLKIVVILAFLGMARYASVKQLDYQEHVSEYGVHWNFFFTLAVCKFFSTFLLYFSSESFDHSYSPIMLSFVLLAIHEFILYCGVQDWVFGDSLRDSLLSANREGLSSCLGYVALYLFGAQVKHELTCKQYPGTAYLFNKRIGIGITVFKFVVGSILLWILTFLSNYLRPASRTLANASYCIFIEAIMLTIVTISNYFEKHFFNEKGNLEMPKIIENINSNGLLIFIVANLLTGAINLSMRTLLVSTFDTFFLLNVYMINTLLLPRLLKRIPSLLLYRMKARRNVNK